MKTLTEQIIEIIKDMEYHAPFVKHDNKYVDKLLQAVKERFKELSENELNKQLILAEQTDDTHKAELASYAAGVVSRLIEQL